MAIESNRTVLEKVGPYRKRILHLVCAASIDITKSVMDVPLPVQEALWDSIASGTFIDTKFWVFSKRSSKAGRVGEPKALYVNGHVVRSVPRLGARTNVSSNR